MRLLFTTLLALAVQFSVANAEVGMASYYWQGQALASGGRFNPDGISCAHKHLPFGTVVRVTNRNNGRSVDCRINDRGPYVRGRIVDLSRGAAKVIQMTGAGVVGVTVDVINGVNITATKPVKQKHRQVAKYHTKKHAYKKTHHRVVAPSCEHALIGCNDKW